MSSCGYKPQNIKNIESIAEKSRKECCTPLTDIQTNFSVKNEMLEFTLNENDKKIMLGNSEYYYYAVEIPNSNENEQNFRLDTYFFGSDDNKKLSIPTVWILNDDFSVSRKSEAGMLNYAIGNYAQEESFYIHIRTNADKYPQEKYIVITSDSLSIGKSVGVTTPINNHFMPIITGKYTSVVPISSGGRNIRFKSTVYKLSLPLNIS